MQNKAIVVMDFINEIVHPDGKFKAKGYADFVQNHSILDNVNKAIGAARMAKMLVIHVRIGFSRNYQEQPKNSPLFGKADEYEAVKLGTWATEFHKDLDVQPNDPIIVKHRISPFYSTSLELWLRTNQVTDIYLAGVATDIVVQSAARDAHDRGFNVFVLSDCCAAGNDEDHDSSVKTMAKISKVGKYSELLQC